MSAVAALLPGNRLHLQHGPIDLVIGVEGPAARAAYRRASRRFESLLASLAAELPDLRSPDPARWRFADPVARRMARAVRRFDGFITPMAAVAGAVADEILLALKGDGVDKAYVNNGGDIALHLGAGQALRLASPCGPVMLEAGQGVGGVATSGWRGRSHSLGIADAVTVLARDAATADAAATLIANAVDLPGDPRIGRSPARDLSPDSDLGKRRVTVHVPDLPGDDAARALDAGLARAKGFQDKGLILAATLLLQGQTRVLTPKRRKDLTHA